MITAVPWHVEKYGHFVSIRRTTKPKGSLASGTDRAAISTHRSIDRSSTATTTRLTPRKISRQEQTVMPSCHGPHTTPIEIQTPRRRRRARCAERLRRRCGGRRSLTRQRANHEPGSIRSDGDRRKLRAAVSIGSADYHRWLHGREQGRLLLLCLSSAPAYS